jgi:hypothetical protein
MASVNRHRYLRGTFVVLSFCLALGAKVREDRQQGASAPQKTTGDPVVTFININNISTPLRNNGIADVNVAQTLAGFVFPKGSGKTCVFESGFLWSGKVPGDPQVRVGGAEYKSGLQPGKLISAGVAEDPNLPKNRIYRVRPDYRTADLSSEIRDEGKSAADIRAQYEKDWNEWPAADGAPYTDVNGNGTYDPSVDIPGVPGADQTVWFVANDNNSTNTSALFGTQPMGIECQFTIWGYAQEGPLGNMIFKSYTLINKGNTELDSMYVTQWADPDDGDATDDFAGCDTSLSLGYCYNGKNVDPTYNPLPPPAVGFDFFQGPKVPSPGSQAIFRGRILNGYKNLPMTAYYYFINSDPTLADPTLGDPSGSTQFYNFMRGRIGLTGQLFQDPHGNPTTFCLTGDPQAGTGWLDGQQFPAGDRRIGLASGPFTMAPGDTQEIVVAEIAGGAIPGVDRLTAVGLLKFFDKAAQLAYDNFFQLPSPPPRPQVTVSELDRKVIMNWGGNQSAVNATESSDTRGFKFQGYNVYQLPSASATITQAKKVAVFDAAGDGITRVTDQVFDPSLGVVVSKVVQLGTDSGIKRYFTVTGDAFNGNAPLIDGIKYYFAVTAYSFNPDPNAIPNNLENPLQIITVTPHSANPGYRLRAAIGDTVTTVHSAGSADGAVLASIVDPSKVTGDDYEVQVVVTDSVSLDFEGAPLRFPNPRWQIFDKTKNALVSAPSTVFTSSTADPIIDGSVQVGIAATPFWTAGQEVSSQTYQPDAHFNWTGVSAGLAFFGGGLDVAYNFLGGGTSTLRPFEVTKTVEVRFDSASGQSAYDFKRTTTGGSGSAPYAGFFPQPFKVFDVTDPAHERQIDFVFMEMDGQPTEDNVWAPGTEPGDREYFWFIDEDYTPTAKAEYTGNTLGALLSAKPGLYGGWYTVTDPSVAPYRNGDVWRIVATHVINAQDRWTFSTAGRNATSSAELAKADVQAINVFPNPYYGVNTEEINKYQRFVIFSHLPTRATIRIFNLAGVQIRQIEKNSDSQFERWDLANQAGLPVGSGLYIVHILMPDLGGVTKILKVAVIQEQQILDRF